MYIRMPRRTSRPITEHPVPMPALSPIERPIGSGMVETEDWVGGGWVGVAELVLNVVGSVAMLVDFAFGRMKKSGLFKKEAPLSAVNLNDVLVVS